MGGFVVQLLVNLPVLDETAHRGNLVELVTGTRADKPFMRTGRHGTVRLRKLGLVDRGLPIAEIPLSEDAVGPAFLVPHVVIRIGAIFLTDALLVIVTGGKLQVNIVFKLEIPLPNLEPALRLERIGDREVITDIDVEVVVQRGMDPRGFPEVFRRVNSVAGRIRPVRGSENFFLGTAVDILEP